MSLSYFGKYNILWVHPFCCDWLSNIPTYIYIYTTLNNLFIFGCPLSSLLHGRLSRCGRAGYALVAVQGFSLRRLLLLRSMACRVRGLQWFRLVGSVVVVPGLQSTGSTAVARGLSCSAARGIFPDQGSIKGQ